MAGAGPRLAGTFDVTGTIKGNDFGIAQGTKTPEVFKFTSKCKSGACARVKLDRDGGDHSHYKSTLRKVKPGVYKGTEGLYPCSCPNNPQATFTAKHTTKITIANCPFGSFVNYTLKGAIR